MHLHAPRGHEKEETLHGPVKRLGSRKKRPLPPPPLYSPHRFPLFTASPFWCDELSEGKKDKRSLGAGTTAACRRQGRARVAQTYRLLLLAGQTGLVAGWCDCGIPVTALPPTSSVTATLLPTTVYIGAAADCIRLVHCYCLYCCHVTTGVTTVTSQLPATARSCTPIRGYDDDGVSRSVVAAVHLSAVTRDRYKCTGVYLTSGLYTLNTAPRGH